MDGAGRGARLDVLGLYFLLPTIIESYGDLFTRTFAIPGIGHWEAIGLLEDLFAVAVLAGIIKFTVIRWRNSASPRPGRGCHPVVRFPAVGGLAAG